MNKTSIARKIYKLALGIVGMAFIPTSSYAEPTYGLKDTENAHLQLDSIAPLSKEDKLEELRAYHSYLDKMSDLFEPDPEGDDYWTLVHTIQRTVVGVSL